MVNNTSLLEQKVNSDESSKIIRPHRTEWLTRVLEMYIWHKLHNVSKNTYDIPISTRIYIQYHNEHRNDKDGIGLFFVPLHANFLETLLIPCVIKEIIEGTIPYSIMDVSRIENNNTLKNLANAVGVFTLKKKSKDTGKIVRDAGLMMMYATESVLSHNGSIIYYGEGTRTETGLTGPFAVAGFQGAINAAGTRPVFAIPVTVMWPYIDEVMNGRTKDYGFKEILDSFKIYHGNVHISFGKPIEIVAPKIIGLSDNEATKINKDYREQLKLQLRNACIDLKRILPEYIHAGGMLRLNPTKGTPINYDALLNNISSLVADLQPYKEKFIGIPIRNLDPEIILERSRLPTDSKLMNEYRIYYNLMDPFLPKNSNIRV